jgi:hypothetical protein
VCVREVEWSGWSHGHLVVLAAYAFDTGQQSAASSRGTGTHTHTHSHRGARDKSDSDSGSEGGSEGGSGRGSGSREELVSAVMCCGVWWCVVVAYPRVDVSVLTHSLTHYCRASSVHLLAMRSGSTRLMAVTI